MKQQIPGRYARRPGTGARSRRDWKANLCREADLDFRRSDEDAARVCRSSYGVAKQKIVLVPNGVDPEKFSLLRVDQRAQAQARPGIPVDRPVLIFIGSGYGPNTEAARFLVTDARSTFPWSAPSLQEA